MKKYGLLVVISLMLIGLNLMSSQLKPVKTIGDESADYTFYIITDAVLSKDKEIFILDSQAFSVAKYSWSGEFIKRIGQKGQGPGDILKPRGLDICNNKLYLLDSGNKRIAESDLQLETVNYFKMGSKASIDYSFYALPNNTFIGALIPMEENRNRIRILDKSGNIVRHFFNELPIPIEIDMTKLTRDETIIWRARHSIFSNFTIPLFALDKEKKQLLVSFQQPANPIRFFVYNLEGERIKEFSYPLDPKYQFNDFYINIKSLAEMRDETKFPSKSFVPYVLALFIHKDHYIVQLRLVEFNKKKQIASSFQLLIFDKEGKLKDKLELEHNLKTFTISPEGYVLGTISDEEVTKLYIYQLTL